MYILSHGMVDEKLPQQIYNILEKSYEAFYHIVFLQVCKSFEIIPTGFCIKKAPCVGNPSKNFFVFVGEGVTCSSVKFG